MIEYNANFPNRTGGIERKPRLTTTLDNHSVLHLPSDGLPDTVLSWKHVSARGAQKRVAKLRNSQ